MRVRSKVSVKSQTVLPREVRERLQIRPGDHVAYVIDEKGVHLEKDSSAEDPFVTFTEWASEADEKAYADL
jgi:antitoxin PrlF